MLHRSAFLLPWLLALNLVASAASPPIYIFGESWWEEYVADDDTEILLHFGPPQVSDRQKLATEVKTARQQEQKDRDLLDLDNLDDAGGGDLGISVTPDDMRQKPVDDANVPPTVVLDYSTRRRRLQVPAGARKVPDGRFGAGLAFDGSGPGLAFQIGGSAEPGVELSFRVAAYPAQTVCLIAVARDASRLLLHPDGHLELKLATPHGEPRAAPDTPPLTPAQIAAITARDATIRSPRPVALDQWVHVQIFNLPHPTPGGGEPWDARLKVDGFDVAWYQSERFNRHEYLGRSDTPIVIGNSAAGDQAFTGVVDQVRVLRRHKTLYERPLLPWRQTATHAPQFGRPFFRRENTVFHASFTAGVDLDRHRPEAPRIALDLLSGSADGMRIPGIRGDGWVIDRRIGYPRLPLAGMNALNGAVEFWLRPVNWDDVTGYWHHTPPRPPVSLTVAQFVGRDPTTGQEAAFMRVQLPRAHNLEHGRMPIDPGHWMHLVVDWNDRWLDGGSLYIDGRRRLRVWRADPALIRRIEPLYVEFGVQDSVSARRDDVPLIEIDEVVGYSSPLDADEITQARARWEQELQPIRLYEMDLDFKWSLQRLDLRVVPKLPDGVTAASCRMTLNYQDEALRQLTSEPGPDGAFHFRFNDATPLPYGDYAFPFALLDADGKEILAGTQRWSYTEEPWRHHQAGILDQPIPPWTPIAVADGGLSTRMSRYVFGDSPWPREIHADGVNLLAGPMRFYEADRELTATATWGDVRAVDAAFRADIRGQSVDIALEALAEYDGMLKYTLHLRPKAQSQPRPGATPAAADTAVQSLRLEIPIRPELATHLLWYPMGNRGVAVANIPAEPGMVRDSGWPANPWKDWAQARKAGKSWDDWWPSYAEENRGYGFYGSVDINDRNRGLWWFCDNAAGWLQSPKVGAIQVLRRESDVVLVLNLVAEAGAYTADRPIVFALLPHPARPMVPEYRAFQRQPLAKVGLAADIFDAFRPWPTDPRDGQMKLYPAADPKAPDAGPSWTYAESAIPSMRAAKPDGARTLYLSKAWFSCRAGQYDHWEWRSGEMNTVSLTPSFVNYLCWEMDQWIGREIFDAIYLDECYEHPALNPLAGHSVRLPDGSEQPGVTNFQFRELMKRWRGIFIQHGRTPYLMAHHTYSWQYPGILYADAYLDGENAPIVSLNSPDWIDSINRTKYEIVQNSRLWGLASFYMPFIAEGGFEDKNHSQFLVWQWRMARQAQALFAHYETATVYEGQGADVHHRYWDDVLGWGADDVQAVSFHPYWDAAGIAVDAQGRETLVSYYRKDGAILLIASNLRKQQTTARITLDPKALGLSGDLHLRERDGSFERPPGDDYLGAKGTAALHAEAQNALDNNSLLGGDGDLLEDLGGGLDGEAEKQAAAREKLNPSLDGYTLVLPIRARDYRVIAIESR